MRKLSVVLLIVVSSCQLASDNKKEVRSYFDLNGFIHQLITDQLSASKYPVIKTSIANGTEEQVVVEKPDSLFWNTELTPLIKADINKPSLVDSYKINDGLKEQNSNLKKLVYSAKPETNTDVIRLEIKYLENIAEVRQVVVWVETKNPVYSARQKIDLWVNRYKNQLLIDSLSIKGFNKTLLQDSLQYKSKLIVKH